MKKIYSFLLVGFVATTSVYPQVMFMPKAGATLSNVAFSDDIKDSWGADFGSKIGFVVGIAAEIPLGGEMLALQPELLWNQKGFSYKYEEPGYKEDYNYTFNYLELPLLVKVKTGVFYALAGPSIGYGIIGRYNGTYSENGSEIDDADFVYFGGEASDYDEDEEYVDNALDIGLQIGAGVNVSPFVFELRYGFGLTDLYDKRPGFTDVKSQHRSLQFTMGLPLGSRDK